MADSSNTARNFILIGALLGISAAAAGFYISSSVEIPIIDPRVESRGKTPSLTAEAARLQESALAERMLADAAPAGAIVPRLAAKDGGVPRYTPLFFPPKLWQVTEKGSRSVRDLLNPKAENVQPAVANAQFFKYGMEDIIGREDVLELDLDNDGFTNGEEFEAGTNPNDAKSMPPFATKDGAKMVWSKINDDKHTLVLGSSYSFTGDIAISIYEGAGSTMKQPRSEKWDVNVGDSFGLSRAADKGALAKNRFKVLSQGEENGSKYIEIEDTFTKLEQGKTFKLFPGESKKHEVSDVAVTLIMTAGSQKGSALKQPVQQGENFDVPGFDGVKCTLTKASPKNVLITVDGIEEPIKLKKLPTPPKNKQQN